MIQIAFSWHLLILIAALVIGFIWVMSLDDFDGLLGSERTWGCFFYIVVAAHEDILSEEYGWHSREVQEVFA